MASAAMRYLLLLVAIVGLTHALVPKPAQISTGTGSTSACFQLSTSSTSSVLQNALQRYQSIIYPFGVPISGCGSLQTVNVVVASNDEPKLLPGVGMYPDRMKKKDQVFGETKSHKGDFFFFFFFLECSLFLVW
jgi:hypothetical protein